MNSTEEPRKQKNKDKSKSKKHKNPFRHLFYDFVKVTGALSAFVYIRPKRIYENKKATKALRGRLMVASNHTGVLDALPLHFAFPTRRLHFLAMKEVFSKPLGRWFFTHVLCIPVDRQNFGMASFNQAVDVLRDDRTLCIFPEGAINAEGKGVNAYKQGVALIAIRGKAPIVPVYIAPRKKWYKRTVIVIGEPITVATGDIPVADMMGSVASITEQLHEKELALADIYEKWKNRKSTK